MKPLTAGARKSNEGLLRGRLDNPEGRKISEPLITNIYVDAMSEMDTSWESNDTRPPAGWQP
jgi:hypothetical protein